MFLEGRGLKPIALSVDDYFKERDETPLDENGFRTGVFNITEDSYLFCASDALAFYILLIFHQYFLY